MRDGKGKNGNITIIDKGSASIAAGADSGYLTKLSLKLLLRLLFFQTGWLIYWVWSF